MSNVPSDLIGEKRGKLTVISVSNRIGKKGQAYINCQCACGKPTEMRVNNFKAGKGLSCGCNQRKNTNQNRVNIVINNNPSRKARISAEQTQLGNHRRCIEDILAARGLEREFSLDNY